MIPNYIIGLILKAAGEVYPEPYLQIKMKDEYFVITLIVNSGLSLEGKAVTLDEAASNLAKKWLEKKGLGPQMTLLKGIMEKN